MIAPYRDEEIAGPSAYHRRYDTFPTRVSDMPIRRAIHRFSGADYVPPAYI